MGESTAKALEEIVHKVGDREGGVWATVVGVGALILTATGVFGEVQSALNVIWKAKDSKAKERRSTLSRLARARAASLGLVVTSGFLITVSLATSAALEALSGYLRGVFPGAETVLTIVDFVISTTLIGFLFAAIYKVLPDKPIAWRDVAIGALVTALLFEGGKYLIALYIGKSDVASTYGAAGALVVLLLWIYYTAQIFLLGAEFTYAYARRYGSLSAAAPTGEGARLGDADREALHELLGTRNATWPLPPDGSSRSAGQSSSSSACSRMPAGRGKPSPSPNGRSGCGPTIATGYSTTLGSAAVRARGALRILSRTAMSRLARAVLRSLDAMGVAEVKVAGAAVSSVEDGTQYYVIKSGDTLSAIAKQFYGDANQYPKIFDANREVIKDANLIFPGQKIRIPKA